MRAKIEGEGGASAYLEKPRNKLQVICQRRYIVCQIIQINAIDTRDGELNKRAHKPHLMLFYVILDCSQSMGRVRDGVPEMFERALDSISVADDVGDFLPDQSIAAEADDGVPLVADADCPGFMEGCGEGGRLKEIWRRECSGDLYIFGRGAVWREKGILISVVGIFEWYGKGIADYTGEHQMCEMSE